MSHRIRFPLVGALLSALFVVGLLAGTGMASNDSHRDSEAMSVDEWNGAGPEVGAESRSAAQHLFESFSGTQAQRSALAVVAAYGANAEMDRCMSEEGFPEWDWSLASVPADPDDALKTSLWLNQPMSYWRSHDLVSMRPFLFAEKEMNNPTDDAEEAATARCKVKLSSPIEGAAASTQTEADADSPSRAIEKLQDAWWAQVAELDDAVDASPDDYYSCLQSKHLSIFESQDLEVQDLGYAMSGASPDDDAIPSDISNEQEWQDGQWQTFLSVEREYFDADWSCRASIYAENIDRVDSLVDSFEHEYADQIRRASDYWGSVEKKARQLS